jgi:hypothetical protein
MIYHKLLQGRKMKRIIVCFLSLVLMGFSGGGSLFGGSLYEHEIAPFTVPSARNHAMGGPHVAYTDDINSLFINPAAFVTAKQLSIAELSVGTHGDVFGLKDALTGGGEMVDNLLSWVEKTQGSIPFGFDLRGPLALGSVGNGWGWGVFDRIHMDMSMAGSTLSAAVYGDVMFNIGYAFRVVNTGGHTVDVGALGKAFGRYSMDTGKMKILDLAANADNLTDKLTDSFLTVGGGIDIGAQYRLLNNFTAGLAVGDLFSLGYAAPMSIPGLGSEGSSPAGYLGYISPKINLGVSYRVFENDLVAWVLMADYRDFINLFQQNEYHSTNAILNLSLGTEVTLLDIVSFRAGLNQMLPAAGIGVDMKVLQIDAAIYGKELGNDPGKFSTYALDLGILFRY